MSFSRPLAIFVPHVPPVTCGVGDYSARLLETWHPERPLHIFVPQNGDGTVPEPEFRGAPVEHLPMREPALRAALAAVGDCDVLVHYSGFGYHARGYPRALIRSLVAWRAAGRGNLIVMLHELWDTSAEGTLRAPIEWLHRRAVRRLAQAADTVITNTESHAARLRALLPDVPVLVRPVVTNIPILSTSVSRTAGMAVLFGMQGSRVRSLEALGSDLRALTACGRLNRIVLAGGGDQPRSSSQEDKYIAKYLPARAVERFGKIPAEQVAALLAEAEFGLCETEWKDWGKSTVFMTYAAHGLNVISPHAGLRLDPPFAWLTHPRELLGPDARTEELLAGRTAALRRWYEQLGGWPRITATFRAALAREVEL